jgi:hypothetical protein
VQFKARFEQFVQLVAHFTQIPGLLISNPYVLAQVRAQVVLLNQA